MAVPVTTVQQGSVPNEWPVVHLVQDGATTQDATLYDRNGDSFTLDADVHEVTFIAREYWGDSTNYISKPCVIRDADTVRFTIQPADVPYGGIWLGQFGIVDTSLTPDKLIAVAPCYVQVQPTLAASDSSYSPISIAEVRMFVRDRDAVDNTFLDELEFSDAEIAACIRRPVDYWNEARPPISRTYTPATFPHRYHWIDGTIAELLRLAGLQLVRNRVPVNAGGVQMDAKARGADYLKISDYMQQEYRDWVASKKMQLNINAGWGSARNTSFD